MTESVNSSRSGITFNQEKFSLSRKEVEFLGFLLTEDFVKPSPDMLKSIAHFRSPET